MKLYRVKVNHHDWHTVIAMSPERAEELVLAEVGYSAEWDDRKDWETEVHELPLDRERIIPPGWKTPWDAEGE